MLAQRVPSDGHVIFPQQAVFKPDEVLSVKNALAVVDKSYTKVQLSHCAYFNAERKYSTTTLYGLS
jgi:hypothetical protein